MKELLISGNNDGGRIGKNARCMMMYLSIPIDEELQQTLSFFEKVWYVSPKFLSCIMLICSVCIYVCLGDLWNCKTIFQFYVVDSSTAWRFRHVGFQRCFFSISNRIISTTSFVISRIPHETYGGICWEYWSTKRTPDKLDSIISTNYFLQYWAY